MRAYVFVEDEADAEVLKQVLTPEASRDVGFVVAGAGSGLVSLARSLLVRRRKPVAVLLDSGSVHPEVIQERRENTEELIRAAAGTVPVTVVLAVPELESVFFHAPEVLDKLFGTKVPGELLSLGRRDPVGVLRELSRQRNTSWDMRLALQSLDAQDLERLRSAPPIQELSAFLQTLQEAGATAAGKA